MNREQRRRFWRDNTTATRKLRAQAWEKIRRAQFARDHTLYERDCPNCCWRGGATYRLGIPPLGMERRIAATMTTCSRCGDKIISEVRYHVPIDAPADATGTWLGEIPNTPEALEAEYAKQQARGADDRA